LGVISGNCKIQNKLHFFFFFFGDISPIKKADVSGNEQTEICVLLYTLWVCITRPKICVWASKMDGAKGRQEKDQKYRRHSRPWVNTPGVVIASIALNSNAYF
jgi:hypothetical protein